ncbi:MAG: hypothetical protein J4A00_09585 [Gammaproteobacteria bacterium]|nr:hypothetical protein [Gammaproteobacteria bacterium]
MSEQSLPAQFKDLEQFVDNWALGSLKERARARAASTMEELHAFYDVISPRMDEIMEYLTGFPAAEEEQPKEVRRLVSLAKSFMQIGIAIELFDAPEEPNVFDLERVNAY